MFQLSDMKQCSENVKRKENSLNRWEEPKLWESILHTQPTKNI